MNDRITVAAVKAKPDYSHVHVNRLCAAVRRHLSVPHRFICLTDDPRGVACATHPLPRGVGGWWAKLALFADRKLNGRVIYFDLDTLIVDSIDFMAHYDGDFALLRDFYRPEGYGSGVMLWNKPRPDIWSDWDAAGRPIHPLGDQGWMEQKVANADRVQDLWPGRVVSYKVHCQDARPEKAAVICFHGVPKMDDFDDTHWVRKAWTST